MCILILKLYNATAWDGATFVQLLFYISVLSDASYCEMKLNA